MNAVGSALIVASNMTKEKFRESHPGGGIGLPRASVPVERLPAAEVLRQQLEYADGLIREAEGGIQAKGSLPKK